MVEYEKFPDPRDGILGKKRDVVSIGSKCVGSFYPTYVIAEIGLNHDGNIKIAKELIDVASECGVDAVKFQKRTLEEIYTAEVLEDPNTHEEGFRYLIPILAQCELSKDELRELKAYAEQKNLEFLCTPFDERSVDLLEDLGLVAYKVASGDFNNLPLIDKLIGTNKPLIFSTGMSPLQEIDFVGQYISKFDVAMILLHCVSAYPTPVEDSCLRMIKFLNERYGVPAGLSSHEIGIDVTLAGVAAGASLVERHITFDKRAEGPDHAASLEPCQLKQLVNGIRTIDKAMGGLNKTISRVVVRNRETLGKSLVAARKISTGETITRSMVCTKGPAKGLPPLRLYDLLGKKLNRSLEPDDLFLSSDCDVSVDTTPLQKYDTSWGLKGRYPDLDFYAERLQPKFIEAHLNDQDLECPFEELYGYRAYPFGIMLHYPTYWHRGVVNLADEDLKKRYLFIDVVQKVIDQARNISEYFEGTPRVVVHMGGMDIEEKTDNDRIIELAYDSLTKLDYQGVEFLPENVPPRPWYFSGQWYDNAFSCANEMINLCKEFNLEMCFDLSHAKLHCNVFGDDYLEYCKAVAPYTAHLHVSDAYGIDGEGVQIGEGEIDFEKVFSVLDEYGNLGKMTWVPEIWQGHNNNYAGFLLALERLGSVPQLKPLPRIT